MFVCLFEFLSNNICEKIQTSFIQSKKRNQQVKNGYIKVRTLKKDIMKILHP